MFILPDMLRPHLDGVAIKQPDDFENYDANEFPHFHVFLMLHLARPIDVAAISENARIIASIPDDEIRTITIQELLDLGMHLKI